MRLSCLCQYHYSGCVHVESMHGGLVDHILEMSPDPAHGAVLISRTAARDGEKAAGFINDNDIGVGMEYFHGL